MDVYNHLVTGASISNNFGSLVLTDFTKAFDTIYHVIAIENLLSLGVSPTIVHWIANFLCDRQQRVTYQQAFSDWQTLSNRHPFHEEPHVQNNFNFSLIDLKHSDQHAEILEIAF